MECREYIVHILYLLIINSYQIYRLHIKILRYFAKFAVKTIKNIEHDVQFQDENGKYRKNVSCNHVLDVLIISI